VSADAHAPRGRATMHLASRLRSVTDVALRDHAERETEILRQLADVSAELKRLSEQVAAREQAVSETNAKLQPLISMLEASLETQLQTTELLGRLLESARGRLEVLEEALNSAR
jgi:uncharacterized protein involved in exopolysaccharide biosynthesis